MKRRISRQPVSGETDPAATGTGRDGAILAISAIMLVLLSLIGIGLLRLSGANAIDTSTSLSRYQAFWAAEAGLEQAKAIAHKNRTLHHLDEVFPTLGSRTWTGQTSHCSYSVSITDGSLSTNPNYAITSEALSHGGMRKGVEVNLLQVPAISVGVFGDREIELKPGIKIYSYDSDDGTNPLPDNSTGEASVGSNGEIDMQANPNFNVDGTILLGANPEGTDDADLDCTGSGCSYYEGVALQVGHVDADPLGINDPNSALAQDFTSIMSANDNLSATGVISGTLLAVSGSGTNLEIQAGDYYLTDVDIGDFATLSVVVTNGPVRFYLTGSMRIDSHADIHLIGGAPSDFIIYANASDPDDIWIQPETDFEGFIYAPNLLVHMEPGGDVKGALWAGQTELFPGGVIFLDTALLKYEAFGVYRIEYAGWREYIVP